MSLIQRIKDKIYLMTNGKIRFKGQLSLKELREIWEAYWG